MEVMTLMKSKQNIIKMTFENFGKANFGVYFSGITGEGEYKGWSPSRYLQVHCWCKNGNREGEYKFWLPEVRAADQHLWFIKDKEVEFPKDVKLKSGYILGGDGKYYKD